jgi:hypothetical protein
VLVAAGLATGWRGWPAWAAVAAMLATAADAEETAWTPERLRTTDEAYHAGHRGFLLDPVARNLRNTLITKSGPEAASPHWIVRQILVDAEELNDWMLEFEIDLPASRAAKQPTLRLLRWCALI